MIDLHAHTSVSDGTVSPGELVRLARKRGLTAVALTDHDSIAGHDEAQREADRLGMPLVKGIEFSVSYGENRLIHILGLGMDGENETFRAIYTGFRKNRAHKLDHIFDAMNRRGIPLGRKEAEAFVGDGFMDRQAIAKSLVAGGFAPEFRMPGSTIWIGFPIFRGNSFYRRKPSRPYMPPGGKPCWPISTCPSALRGTPK